jgi:iron complex outermembrane recepter protein
MHSTKQKGHATNAIFRKTPLSIALAAAAGGWLGSIPTAVQGQVLEEVLVTGSHIRRDSQLDNLSATMQVDEDEIARQGASAITDVIKNLNINIGGDFQADTFTSNSTVGTSNINLRNLGLGSTLILINGARQTTSSAANQQGSTFVDTNSLMPLIMVERIEILKEGATSTYGSDAVAGVVNFITRSDFEGAEFDINYQSVTDGGQSDLRLGAIWGGKVNDGKTHIVGAINYLERDPLWARDRDYTDGTFNSSFGRPGTFIATDGSGTRFLDPACGVGNSFELNGICFTNIAGNFQLIPAEEQLQLFSTVTHQFSDRVQGVLELGYADNETKQANGPSNPAGGSPLVPLSNPAAQLFGQEVVFQGRPKAVGFAPETDTYTHETWRIAGGLTVQLDNEMYWDTKAAYSYNDSWWDSPITPIRSRFINALAGSGGPNGNETFNPLYDGENSASLIEYISTGSPELDSNASLLSVDSVLSGEWFELNGGTVGFALGAHFRREKFEHDFGPIYNAEDLMQLGGGGPDSEGDRDIYAVFGELNVPLGTTLEAQLALRYEDYGDGIDSLDPKLSLLWRPTDTVSLRASASTAFRGPSLFQVEGVQTSVAQILDPVAGNNQISTASAKTRGGELDPETANVYNLGVTVAPVDDMELSIDYWRFEYEDVLSRENAQSVVNSNDPNKVIRDPFSNAVSELRLNYVNAALIDTDGVDFAFRYRPGNLFFGADLTWINSYDLQATKDSPTVDAVGSRNNTNIARPLPEIRANGSVGWETENQRATLYVRYTDEYKNDSAGDAKVDSWTTLDLQYAYTFRGVLGDGDTVLTFGVINATDEDPPSMAAIMGFDVRTHDPRGRLWYAGINYSF